MNGQARLRRTGDGASLKQTSMINSVGSCADRAEQIAAFRQNRAKQIDAGQDTSSSAVAQHGHAHQNQHRPPGLARAAENIANKIFASADADGSSGISKEELSSALSKRADRINSDDLFTALDTDTDGSVSQTELQDALKKFFYSKVGVTYQPPAPPTPPATEPDWTTPSAGTTGSGDSTTSVPDPSFTAVA